MQALKKINKKHVPIIILFIISFLYIFLTYGPWLTSNCIAPLGADIKHHITNIVLFREQIREYGTVYPVEYMRDISGYYWYTKNFLPIIVPSLFTLFLELNTAFFLFYLILYLLVVLALYMLVRELTDQYTGFIIALFFLLSNLSNMIFSVGGNYQYLFGLLFFFMSMNYLFKYSKDKTKKSLTFLIISIISLGLSYTFSLIFFLSFAMIYALITKQRNLIKILIISILTLSISLVPSFITGSYLHINPENNFPTPLELLKTYILPSNSFSWIYQPIIDYKGELDFNQGIHIYLAGLIALLYIITRKIKTEETKFIHLNLIIMVGWVILGFLSILEPFSFLKSFFSESVNTERLMMHVALAFLLPIAYILYKLKTQLKSFIAVFLLSFIVLGISFLGNKLFFMFIGIIPIFILKKKENISKKDIFITSIIIILLLFPLTGKVETTNIHPRVDYILLDDIKNIVNKNDTIYYVGGWSLQESIIACTKAHSIVQTDKDGIISGLKEDIDVFNQEMLIKDKLETRGITKLLIVGDQLIQGKQIVMERISHLIKWFGKPEVMQLKSWSQGKTHKAFPIFIFHIQKKARDYEIKTNTPINLLVTNTMNEDNLLLNLEWHPWWSAKNTETSKEIQIENKEGLINLMNTKNSKTITMNFSIKYFILGALLSIIGLFLIIKEIRKTNK